MTAPERNSLRIVVAASLALALSGTPAHSLSEIPHETLPIPDTEGDPGSGEIIREQLPPITGEQDRDEQPDSGEDADETPSRPPAARGMPVPLPDPIVSPRSSAPTPASDEDAEGTETAAPAPDILYDLELLPDPVRRMRALVMEACLSGDIERLRPLISTGDNGTQLSFGGMPGDPVDFLREVSGDGEGHEILAILYEVLAAGFVHLDPGEPHEMYVWPYFFAVPLENLNSRQRVELFKLVTAGDYEDMKNYGAYIFYRVGISPEGHWLFFVAGD